MQILHVKIIQDAPGKRTKYACRHDAIERFFCLTVILIDVNWIL